MNNFIFILIISFFVSLYAGFYAIMKRRMPGSITGGFLILHGAIWTYSYLLQNTAQNPHDTLFFFKIQFLFGLLMPPLYTVYITRYFELKFSDNPSIMYAIICSIPTLTAIQIIVNDPFNVIWATTRIIENNQVLLTPGPMALIAIAFNYISKIITILYFSYTIIKDKKLLTTRTLIFTFATTLYCIIYAIDLLHLSPGQVILSSLIFNILSSGIMLASPEKMYKRDVLPVVNNLVIENLDSPVFAVDNNNKILFMNSKAQKMLHREVKFLQNGLEEVFESLTVYLSSEKDHDDYFNYLGKVFNVKYYNIENWREETKTRIYVLVDVTDLVNYSKNLEKTVSEKTKQLVESEKLAAIGTMTSMVGHDLRNPLQVLKFICEEMSKELGDHPKYSVYIQKANKNVIYMDKIVSDLQFVLQNKELSKVKVNLGEMIADAFESVNIPENVQVDSSVGDVYVYVDPMSFFRVLVNLVNNAVQAMPKTGGKVWVECNRESGFDCIDVRDSGIGISSENMEKMFSAFYTTKAKGMGLGLIVCKHIVEAHDGDVSVDSEKGVGTCFKVRIPSKNVVDELAISVDQIIQEPNM